jgi:hypothetical protein
MSRLTFRDSKGELWIKDAAHIDEQGQICMLTDRLAAYEDTGLEPAEIAKVQAALDTIPFGRFYEIMQAEREGRCVVLPCKVGDYLWVNSRYCNRNVPPEKVPCSIYPNCKGCPFKMIEPTPIKVCSMETLGGFLDRNEIGKVLHLTRAEAEAALKEAQHE